MDKFNNINIKKISVGELQENCYLVENHDSASATIIDPGSEANRIIEILSYPKVDSVILTHGHFDHISAIDDLAKKYDFKLYVHEYDAEMLADPEKNLSSSLMIKPIVISHNFITYTDNEIIKSSGLEFEAIHTPGHTKGSTCLLLNAGEENILFTGDTLFAGGYGRTDFYGGDFSSLVNSMRRLYKLEGYYYCYPGHGDNTILGKKS